MTHAHPPSKLPYHTWLDLDGTRKMYESLTMEKGKETNKELKHDVLRNNGILFHYLNEVEDGNLEESIELFNTNTDI